MDKIEQELIQYIEKIEQFDKDSAQDGDALHAFLIDIINMMARANFVMAEYGRKLKEQKTKEYQKLAMSSYAQQKYYAPSLAKDFVASQCSEVGYVYDLAERLSRSCVHAADCIRTIISSLKQERIFSQYQQ